MRPVIKEESVLSKVLTPVYTALISLAVLAGLGGLTIMALKFFVIQLRGVL